MGKDIDWTTILYNIFMSNSRNMNLIDALLSISNSIKAVAISVEDLSDQIKEFNTSYRHK